jgi:putative pyruvate formate lyase activating enzyme
MMLSPREVRARAAQAAEQYARCRLCAHLCGVDRTRGPAGRCVEGTSVFLGGSGIHFGEEASLVGRGGSGVVLIAGCNLACRSCETYELSLLRRGATECGPGQLGSVFLDLERRGAVNLNLVTPTHVLPALLAGLAEAAERGFSLPVVWNCGGYESRDALRLLDGVVDVYLPDAKYGDDGAGLQLSGCPGYTAALRDSLAEMHRQAGALQIGPDGVARRGVLVRHLVLPDGAAAPEAVMRLIASVSSDLWVNVLSQYRPVHEARRFPVLSRGVRPDEVWRAVGAARDAGLDHVLLDGKEAPLTPLRPSWPCRLATGCRAETNLHAVQDS